MMLKKSKRFLLKPLAVCIGLGLTAQAVANNANTAPPPGSQASFPGPFSQVPLHLQEMINSSGSGVKPNVVLQIDNSGSMGWTVDNQVPTSTNRSRIDITRDALLRLLANPKYRDTVNWHMTTLFEKRRTELWSSYASKFLHFRGPFARPPEELERVIRDKDIFKPEGATPSTERYLDTIYLLQRALERPDVTSCQKSYAILFSDGNQNGWDVIMERTHKPSNFDREAWKIPNTSFKLARSGHAKWKDDPLIFFAHEDPIEYSHPNLSAFRISRYGDPKDDNTNFLSYETLDMPTKGWNWANYGHLFTGNTGPHQTSVYFWTNRRNSLRYFAETVYAKDLAPNVPGKQNIETFTIAFGIDPAKEPGAHAYLSGGATAEKFDKNGRKILSKGQVLNASNEEELNRTFDTIFAQIAAENKFQPPTSYASVSPAVSREELTKKVPNMAAAVMLDLQSGSSELRFYNVSGDKHSFNVDKSTYKRPSFGNRRFLMNDGKGWVGWLNQYSGSNAYFGIPDKVGSNNNVLNQNEWSQALLPWLMRSSNDTSLNTSPNYALKYRVRQDVGAQDKRNMGDVVGTPILAYGPPEFGRQKYLITAANDGMVYLFGSANNGLNPYDLRLNYIPAGMERESAADTVATQFKNIVDPTYVTDSAKHPHRFLVNGGFTVRTMDNTGPQQIFMAGNMGQGGRGSYALNVGGPSRNNAAEQVGIDAPEDSWPSKVPLFETPKGAGNVMGYTIGAPQIGRLALNRSVDKANAAMTVDRRDVRYGVFIGSGVRNPAAYQQGNDQTESALYVFNAMSGVNVGLQNANSSGNTTPATSHDNMQAGHLIKKLVAPGAGGLAQPAIVDTDFDGSIDVAYAGDFSGGLYRFDLRGPVNEWTVHKIFQTANNQPITAAPAVFRNELNQYIVIFGTGSDLYQEDLANKDTQSVYGIYDNLTDFAPTVKTVGNLVQQTVTQSTYASGSQNYDVRTLSDNALTEQHKGWYFNLPEPGERVVVKPDMLLKTAMMTTRLYKEEVSGKAQSGVCEASETQRRRTSGESWVLQVKADNGGNIPGKGGDDIYAYADFLHQSTPGSKVRPDILFSGIRNSTGIMSMALLVGSDDPNQVGGLGNSTTLDGDVTNSGVDSPMNDNTAEENAKRIRHCFMTDDNKVLKAETNVATGIDGKSTPVNGKGCQVGGIRRLSWREIF